MVKEVWESTDYVKTLKKFVTDEIVRLKHGKQNFRVKRQIADGIRFLKLLDTFEFCNIKTIGAVKKKIVKMREEIKFNISNMDKVLPGHQLSFFDEPIELDDIKIQKIEQQRLILKEEIKWLHKVLGICHNKEYFR